MVTQAKDLPRREGSARGQSRGARLAYLARTWCAMKAVVIARQLNRDPSMVSRLCASYEEFEISKTEKKIAEMIDK
jgi:hypothetical protein